MRIHDGLNTARLLHMLKRELEAETGWVAFPVSSEDSSSVSLAERNATARWLLAVNTAFGFYPETYVMGVSLLDNFLHSCKVPCRYVRCVGASCLFIAAKFHQEDEALPSAEELVRGAGCSFSGADLRRMELLVLDKLGWAPGHTTCLSLLHIFHALLLKSNPALTGDSPLGPPPGAGPLVQAVFRVVAGPLACLWAPGTLALALLSVQAAMWRPDDWLAPMLGLLSLTKKSQQEVGACREQLMHEQWLLPLLIASGAAPSRSAKRKANDEEIDDDVYECMKRMYSEEGSSPATPRCAVSCSAS